MWRVHVWGLGGTLLLTSSDHPGSVRRVAPLESRSACWEARPAATTSLKERNRKMKITAARPIEAVKIGDRDLLTDRVGDHGRRCARAVKTLTSSACCTPAPPGVNGTAPATWPTPKTSSTFSTGPPDPEGVKEQPVAGKAAQPGTCLQGRHFAQVAPAVGEDRHALTHARPERLDADRQQREGEERRRSRVR